MPKLILRRLLIGVALLIAALLAAPSVSAEEPVIPGMLGGNERAPKPDLSSVKRLRFLTTMDFPPFNFLDASGRLSGFHVDLARAICGELGLLPKCEIQALPWAELKPALESGKGEAIMAGLSITAETRKDYAFTRPYLQFPGRFVVARNSSLAEPLWKTLAGKRVGVVAGSAHERMLRDYFKTATIVPYPHEPEMLADLAAGKVDAVFADGMRLSFWLADGGAAACCRFAGGPYIAPEYFGPGLAIAVPAGKPELADLLDGAITQLQAKGTFAELYLRYFPVSFY
jgi:polar amino acid transport system substrate-binding protein